jgi:hypothetical protein
MKNNLIIKNIEDIGDKIVLIENKPVLLDMDVATFYQVKTREINQAVKNNPEKFPDGYVLKIKEIAKNELVKNFDRFKNLKHSTAPIKAFTERGLYMLATILKGERATRTTIRIIDTFARFREATSNLNLANNSKNEEEKALLLKKSGLALMDLLTDNLQSDTITTKTRVTLDLGILKIEREIEKKKK